MQGRNVSVATVVLMVIAALLSLTSCGGPAQHDPRVPELKARVTDQTGTLTTIERAALEETLAAFERRRGSQVAVLIVSTTQPDPIEKYSLRVARAWRLGRQGINDGVLLLVAVDDRTVRIEVGTGLERTLSNARCTRILEEAIIPAFRKGAFFNGIETGIRLIFGAVDEAGLPPPAALSMAPWRRPIASMPVGDAVHG